jgi:hypothetical protein
MKMRGKNRLNRSAKAIGNELPWTYIVAGGRRRGVKEKATVAAAV